MTSTNQSPDGRVDPSVRELVAQAALETSKLVSTQIELTKAELKESAAQAGATFGMIIAGLMFFSLAGFFFFFMVAFALNQLGLPMWASFGIVTLFLLIVGAILLLVGKKHASKIKGPERSAAQMELTKQAFEDATTSALTP